MLDHIIQSNDQKNLLVMEEVDLDEWNGIIEEKAKSIDQINFWTKVLKKFTIG